MGQEIYFINKLKSILSILENISEPNIPAYSPNLLKALYYEAEQALIAIGREIEVICHAKGTREGKAECQEH